MDVEWRFEPVEEGTRVTIEHRLAFVFRSPRSGSGGNIVSKFFIEAWPRRTLARMKVLAEAPAMNGNGAYRAVVTGIGIVYAAGHRGAHVLGACAAQDTSGVRTITRFDPAEFSSQIAAQDRRLRRLAYLDAKRLRWTDRFAQFSMVASRLALDDAGFSVEGATDETGVYIGSALGGLAYAEEQHDRLPRAGIKHVRPLLAISVFGGAATTQRRDRTRHSRTEPFERQLVRGGLGRDRRGLPRDRPWRRAGGARRRCRSPARAADLRRVLDHPRDVDAQRRSVAR